MDEWTSSSSEEEDLISSTDEESDTNEGYRLYSDESTAISVPAPVISVPAPVSSDPAQTIKLITDESLLPEQKQDLRRVIDILQVNEKQARTLLIHYRWDTDRLVNAFLERGPDWLFSHSGIAIRLESTNSLVTICNVCREDLKEEHSTTMDCGHTFCNACWTEHFLVKINEGQSKRIKCMEAECNIICDEDVVRKLVTANDPDAAQRFDRFLLESYIEDNDNGKWCPSVPKCGNAVLVQGNIYSEIECKCGHQFCFNCLAEPHSPCSCLIWQLWNNKCQDDSDDEQDLIGKAQRDLQRYKHYYSRWQARKDSLKLEENQKKLLEKKLLDLKGVRVRDKSWLTDALTDALQRLYRSRRALSYSYAFAFHMFGDELLKNKITAAEKEIKQALFEDQQQQLEGIVETLSKIIEGPFDEETIMDVQGEVMGLTGLVDNRCINMYETIENDLLRLLGSLKIHGIAPYNPNGVHRLS